MTLRERLDGIGAGLAPKRRGEVALVARLALEAEAAGRTREAALLALRAEALAAMSRGGIR